MICYAVKANSNLHILSLLSKLGSGFDVVSGNELKRCIRAGVDKNKIVFSGVAKSYDEIKYAIESDILSINISDEEMNRRKKSWKNPNLSPKKGVLAKYQKTVQSASQGAITD